MHEAAPPCFWRVLRYFPGFDGGRGPLPGSCDRHAQDEAEHSERRAYAHFRAAATLAPRDLDAQFQALRCRARVLGERLRVLADIGRLDLHSPSLDDLATRLRTLAEIPSFSAHEP